VSRVLVCLCRKVQGKITANTTKTPPLQRICQKGGQEHPLSWRRKSGHEAQISTRNKKGEICLARHLEVPAPEEPDEGKREYGPRFGKRELCTGEKAAIKGSYKSLAINRRNGREQQQKKLKIGICY